MSSTAPDVGMSPALPNRKALTHAARDKLCEANMPLSRSQISELIIRFRELNPWGTKDEFLEFMASEVYERSNAKRRAAAANPDNARTISYADKTGENGAWNVDNPDRRPRGYDSTAA
jgi:hypothetical protein